jgi:hypothetical protein
MNARPDFTGRQLAGERILPARKDAIKHGRKQGLITDSALTSDE